MFAAWWVFRHSHRIIGGWRSASSRPRWRCQWLVAVDRANDMAEWVRDRWALRFALLGVVGMAFVFLHLELDRTFLFLFPPLRLPVLSLLWIGMCGFLLYEYLADRNQAILGSRVRVCFPAASASCSFSIWGAGRRRQCSYDGGDVVLVSGCVACALSTSGPSLLSCTLASCFWRATWRPHWSGTSPESRPWSCCSSSSAWR